MPSPTVQIKIPETVVLKQFDESKGQTVDTEYPMADFVTFLLNTNPVFEGGTREMAQALRIEEAFTGVKPGDLVTLTREAQEKLVEACDKPAFSRMDQQSGKKNKVDGWAISAYQARKAASYMLAIKDAADIEAPKAVPAEGAA
jgi:hypothetical protein